MPIQKWIRPTLILNTLFFITLTSNAWAKVEEKPTLKVSYQSFVPKNWKILEKVQGDLNQDGQADIALIIEDTNPEHIVKNDRLGSDVLNINERKLLVLLQVSSHVLSILAMTKRDLLSPLYWGLQVLS